MAMPMVAMVVPPRPKRKTSPPRHVPPRGKSNLRPLWSLGPLGFGAMSRNVRPRPSMAPALVSGSAWYPDRTWNSWKSKETWIPDKRYQEKDVDIERQKAKSWEKWPSEANYDNDNDNEIELDLVSGKDQLSVEHNDQYKIGHYDNEIEFDLVSGKDQLSVEHNDQYKIGHYDNEIELDLVSGKDQLSVEHKDQYEIGQWTTWLQKWEDEKPGQLKELTSSETCFCENNDDDEFETVPVEDEEDHEWVIRNSLEILQRYRGEAKATVHGSGKPLSRRARARAKARRAKMDDRKGSEPSKVEVGQLRYSQESCLETFQCGRTISELVQDLLHGRVSLSEPFLQLNVFETKDKKTKKRVLRCIDNRRLFALKEYARRSGKDRLMVNVNFFNQNTVKQVQRFIQNSDETDGRHVRLRKNRKGNNRNRT